jgi:hypothetical protein
MNNLLIIGNGFDLAHDMKTSYNHFIENTDRRQSDIIRNHFFEILNAEKNLKNWCDIEQIYFEQLQTNNSDSHYENTEVGLLNKEFDVIKEYLSNYLKTQEKETKTIGSYKEMFELIDSRDTRILNFNYTNTLQTLYSNEIKESKVIHMHGELSNPINPIVFGYAANDKESRELIKKGDNEYMRNIKKHLYKRTDNERRLTYYLKGTSGINVIILGHSCGLSDKLILNQILNNENVQSINIFYYEKYEHYFQTQVNIDRIMNDDDNFKKLTDFNSSHRMPQHNDSKEQQEAFIKYITPIIEKRKYEKKVYDANKSNAVKW